MKVLVVGGAGYIGSHTTYELIRKGHEVVVFDNLFSGNRAAVHPEAEFVEGDLRDAKALDAVFEKYTIDVVMHFAARLIVPESVAKPIEYYENNVYGVGVLLASMLRHGVKKFMFSSTAAVYGEPDTQDPLDEQFVKAPINPYGGSKSTAEDLIQDVGVSDGLQSIIFRYFNVAGSDSSGEIGLSPKNPVTHIIPVVNEAAMGIREKLYVFGDDYPTPDGTCVRDYIHITDLAQAHVLGAEKMQQTPESYIINLGNESGFSVKEIIETTEKVLGKEIPYTVQERRAGDPAKLIASNKRAKEVLGWVAKYSLEDMIASDYAWRTNKKY